MNCKMKNLLLTVLSIMLAFVTFLSIITALPTTAFANTNYDFFMEDGAQTRLDEKRAIRFRTLVDKSQIDANADDVRVVTIIANTEDLVAKELNTKEGFKIDKLIENEIKYLAVEFSAANGNLINNGDYKVPTVNKNDKTYYSYNACIYDIPDENTHKERSARSYIQLIESGEIIDYTDYSDLKNSIDLAEVAFNYLNECINDENIEEFATAYKNLQDIVSFGVVYELNADGTSYVVKGINKEERYLKDELYILGYYTADGTTFLPVTEIASKAFGAYGGWQGSDSAVKTLQGINKVVVHKNVTTLGDRAFYDCSALELAIIPGVTSFLGEFKNNAYSTTSNYHFMNCKTLKSVVLSDGLTSIPQNVFTGTTASVDVCVDGSVDNLSTNIGAGNNLSGNVYTYKEDLTVCHDGKYWSYSKEIGKVLDSKISTEKHSYDNKICTCGEDMSTGVAYAWDSASQSFKVTGLSDETLTEVYVVGNYTDGTNSGPVTKIAETAFEGYSKAYCRNITKIVLHKNVTTLGDRCFQWCKKLETVIAPGVVNITTTTHWSGSIFVGHFATCDSLKAVVFSGEISSILDNMFTHTEKSNQVNIFLDGETNKLAGNIGTTGNELLTSNVYVSSQWEYVGGVGPYDGGVPNVKQ